MFNSLKRELQKLCITTIALIIIHLIFIELVLQFLYSSPHSVHGNMYLLDFKSFNKRVKT